MSSETFDKTDLFENQAISKAVWQLATPTILSMLVIVFYNVADTFFIGQTNDAQQVSAISLAMPVFMLNMAVGNLFGAGGSSNISRALGAGRIKDVAKISAFCFYGALVSGAILGGLMLIFMDEVVKICGANTAETIMYVKQYLTYTAFGTPFIVLSGALGALTRSEGAAKAAMIAMMTGTVVNIILDPIFILYLDFGVSGAAVATIIGNISVILYFLHFTHGKNTNLSSSIKDFTLQKSIVLAVLSIGIPGAISNVLMSIATLTYNLFMVSYGDDPVAGMSIAMKCNMLIFMVIMGFCMGAQPIIGYNYGAQNYDRMKQVIGYAMKTTILIGLTLSTIYIFASDYIIEMFIEDENVIYYGTKILKRQSLLGPLIGIIFVSMASMQAMGKAVLSMILSTCRQGLIFIPTIFITDYFWGLEGLIWTQTVTDIVSVLLAGTALLLVLKKLPSTAEAKAIAESKVVQDQLENMEEKSGLV